jgi:NTP pyrophosphatase (non-canonical NTP hydrolase)
MLEPGGAVVKGGRLIGPADSVKVDGLRAAKQDRSVPTVTNSECQGSGPSSTAAGKPEITLGEFQQLIRRMYMEKDVARGIDGTFMWLMEEVGELAAVLRKGTHEERSAEFADVLAWLATIANVAGVDLTAAVQAKYGAGCPGCGRFVCTCPDAGKP